jgi:hypothetical protein
VPKALAKAAKNLRPDGKSHKNSPFPKKASERFSPEEPEE